MNQEDESKHVCDNMKEREQSKGRRKVKCMQDTRMARQGNLPQYLLTRGLHIPTDL